MGIIAFEKCPGFLLEVSPGSSVPARRLREAVKDRRRTGVRGPQHTPLTVGRGDDEGAISGQRVALEPPLPVTTKIARKRRGEAAHAQGVAVRKREMGPAFRQVQATDPSEWWRKLADPTGGKINAQEWALDGLCKSSGTANVDVLDRRNCWAPDLRAAVGPDMQRAF